MPTAGVPCWLLHTNKINTLYKCKKKKKARLTLDSFYALDCCIDYSHIVLIIAIWPGDRIRRSEHSTVEHGSCDESV